jgi:thiol-disulfide isomerase/thioredoxin
MSNQLIIEMFTSPNCPYCAIIKPKLIEYCKSVNITMSIVDISDEGMLDYATNLGICSLPTIRILLNANVIRVLEGLQFNDVKKNIEFAINKLREKESN